MYKIFKIILLYKIRVILRFFLSIHIWQTRGRYGLFSQLATSLVWQGTCDHVYAPCCNRRQRGKREREIGTRCVRYIGWLERKGNYFEFSAFEWKAHPIDYYRIEQTRSAWSRPFSHPRSNSSISSHVVSVVREF